MPLGSTQPLIKMGIRNLPGGKGWPGQTDANLIIIIIIICEPII
jgi:hypothetical protein